MVVAVWRREGGGGRSGKGRDTKEVVVAMWRSEDEREVVMAAQRSVEGERTVVVVAVRSKQGMREREVVMAV